MEDVLAAVPGSSAFHPLPDGALLVTSAVAARSVLTNAAAVPAFNGARRPRIWYSQTSVDRMSSGAFDVEVGREVLLAELGKSFRGIAWGSRADSVVDTVALLQRPIAHSTIAALLPASSAEARRELVDATLTWLPALATLIIAARTPRRSAESTRRERRERRQVARLLARTGPDVPPALALAAGVQVPTAAAAWLLELLSRHPAVVDRISDREPGWALGAVWETLRLYPPTWGLPRLVIADVTVAGTTLPLASRVVVSPLALGRYPTLYPHADAYGGEFAPQRWLDGSRPGDWLPFGAGPHSCPGRSLALAQLQTTAEFLAGMATVEPVAEHTRIDARNGLLPDPHRVRLVRRAGQHG